MPSTGVGFSSLLGGNRLASVLSSSHSALSGWSTSSDVRGGHNIGSRGSVSSSSSGCVGSSISVGLGLVSSSCSSQNVSNSLNGWLLGGVCGGGWLSNGALVSSGSHPVSIGGVLSRSVCSGGLLSSSVGVSHLTLNLAHSLDLFFKFEYEFALEWRLKGSLN